MDNPLPEHTPVAENIHIKPKRNLFNKKYTPILAALMLAFVVIGGYLTLRSFAATAEISRIEAESMSLPTGAYSFGGTTTGNGQAVVFTTNSSATGSINLPTTASGVKIVARSIKCKGSYGQYAVIIDGKTVMSGTANSEVWATKSATTTIKAGSHAIKFTASNIRTVSGCTSKVYLDVIVFSGTVLASPSPTTTPTTSPTPSATSTSTPSPTPTTASKSIYWGALLDGDQTYSVYYGNPAPDGQNWQDAPWGNTNNTWDKFEANTGKKVSILHYGQPAPWLQTTFYNGTADFVTNRGAIPLIDMSTGATPLLDIANGTYDSALKTWATNVKNWGKPFFLRWDWEMNGTWYDYGKQAATNPASYVSMWRHVHDVVTAQGATNITWVWCPNTAYPGSTPLGSLYPGDAYVDWTCVDGYNKGANSSFSSLFMPTYNQLLSIAPTKPIMIGETSSEEFGGSKAAWITDALTTQLPTNFPQIKAVLWFNWRINEDGVDWPWPIESSASATAAFRSGIASPYYADNKYGNLPALTKVQPLP